MGSMTARCRVGTLVVFSILIVLAAIYGLTKPLPNRCIMTYMYPTYIPIPVKNAPSDKYGLFLYHEGWQQVDYAEHVKNLNGVPVLFIPGNGGSYKQVRSIAAESFRAYQNGPMEPYLYQTASIPPWISSSEEVEDSGVPVKYNTMLDWFAVDLEGEHSAMDRNILHEHTEYVVCAINQILNQYEESQRRTNSGDPSGKFPSSVILVGHSMGGFVARAALIHPRLRRSSVQTIITLSSPHQCPPVALQPSLGQYFSHVNGEWKKAYKALISSTGRLVTSSKFSDVAVISIFGGIHDYQVRSNMASLEGIVPQIHALTIGTSGMRNVWLSTEHQTILWCNQLVVQVSHMLLSMIEPVTRQPYPSVHKRLLIVRRMLESSIPHAFNWSSMVPRVGPKPNSLIIDKMDAREPVVKILSCPSTIGWSSDDLGKDLYVQSSLLTVLAMDGRRRWINIKELGSDGQKHFIFVTNLSPCYGVRIHLWPERHKSSLVSGTPASKRVVEVTSKLVQIPAGPVPKQVEPGSQTEQPAPSAFLLLSPEEMSGFLYITISVAPQPMHSGRPPPAASMGVAQFFDPMEGAIKLSARSLVALEFTHKELLLPEDHPLAISLSFPISLGLLPVTLSLKTASCGMKKFSSQMGEMEQNSLCRARCFPPVAFVWDRVSGLHVIPNFNLETVVLDSSPATWDLSHGADKTVVLLLADPHCSYNVRAHFSLSAAASRFFIVYSSQIVGFMISVTFFALMAQARAWEHDSSMPSMLTAIELNMRIPSPFIYLWLVPTVLCLSISFLKSGHLSPFASFVCISLMCYQVANGFMLFLVLCSKFIFWTAALLHVLLKRRLQKQEDPGQSQSALLNRFLGVISLVYSIKVVKSYPNALLACISIPLVCFVHPAVGLVFVLLFQAFHALFALSSSLAASSPSYTRRKTSNSNINENSNMQRSSIASTGSQPVASDGAIPAKSFGESQLEVFSYRHGIIILHLLATLMFVPSLVSWSQRIGTGQSFPCILDSLLCMGVILHTLFGSTPKSCSLGFATIGPEVGLSWVYFFAGYFTFLGALASAPYLAFYAMAAAGVVCSVLGATEHRMRSRGIILSRKRRKHPHKH